MLAPHFPPSSADADIIDQLGHLGIIDVAWFEMEHGPLTWDRLSDLSRACDLWGITSLVRVHQNEPGVIGRALARGMQSVLVPHVNTREDAERAVAAGLYPPKGMRRGGGRQAYGVSDYYGTANDETMIVVLIEEVEAIRNLKEIVTVPDIDCFLVGPADLAQSMGAKYAGHSSHPEVQAAVRDAIKTIVASGRVAGLPVNDDTVVDFLNMGVQFLSVQTAPYLINGLKQFTRKVQTTTLALAR